MDGLKTISRSRTQSIISAIDAGAVSEATEKLFPEEGRIFADIRTILEKGMDPQQLADRLGNVIDVIIGDLENTRCHRKIMKPRTHDLSWKK